MCSSDLTATGFTAIAAGGNHGYALRSDGSIAAWGSNGGNETSNTPTGTGFVAIAAGATNGFALKSDGTLVTWGSSGYNIITTTPTGGGFTAISAGYNNGFALKSNVPSDISLSTTAIDENLSSGTPVGSFSTTDADSGDSFTYTLVTGAGSTDNASFSISGTSLLSAASFNYEAKNSYKIGRAHV